MLLLSRYFRWRNWIIRGIFTWVMICGFGTVILLGPLCIVLLVCLVGPVVCVCVYVCVRWLVCQWRAWLVIVSHMLMPSFPLKLTVLGLMELLSDIAILSDIVNFISQYVVNFVFPHIRLTALFS